MVSDGLCMSSSRQPGREQHKRIPNNVAEHPVMVGHEFSVSLRWALQMAVGFKPGDSFAIQPALNYVDGPVGSWVHQAIHINFWEGMQLTR